uniref:BACK domain-containing protein n=1 Tax=Mesocestoides corti TaxID=53468 RepID=A0A5K3F671_MESCO
MCCVSLCRLNNCLGFLQFSSLFSDQEISRRSITILQDGFNSVDIMSPDFLSLSSSQVEQLFLSDEINVTNESFMVKALVSWVSHDEVSRFDFFQENFTVLLRLSMVSAESLRQVIGDPSLQTARRTIRLLAHWFLLNFGHPLFSEENHPPEHLKDFDWNSISIDDSIFKSRLRLLINPDSESARVGTDFRVYSVGGVEDVYLMGGNRLNRSFRRNTDFFAFTPNLKKMVPRPPMVGQPRVYHGVAASNTWIYVTGGEYEDQTITALCERFSLVENVWHSMASLDVPRSHHALVCLDGIVYLFGGSHLDPTTLDTILSDSVFAYSHLNDAWTRLSSQLPKKLSDMTAIAASWRDTIFILGGLEELEIEDGLRPTDFFRFFDPARALWGRLPPIPRALSDAAGVCYEPGDCIYLVGGLLSDGSPSNEIFSFSLCKEQWSFVTHLTLPRYTCSVLIHRDKFYVLGGVTLADALTSEETRWLELQLTRAQSVDESVSFRLLSSALEDPPNQVSRETLTNTSSSSASSTSSSWMSLMPQQRSDGDTSSVPRLFRSTYRTCFVPEAWRIVKSTDTPMPHSPSTEDLSLLLLEDHPMWGPDDVGTPRRIERDLLAPYWLQPIRLTKAMGWQMGAANLTPTLRRTRCLARFCLAPMFLSDESFSVSSPPPHT